MNPCAPRDVDASYDQLCRSFEPALAAEARGLPRQLGLDGEAGLWSSYATLPPVVDLPFFMAPQGTAQFLTLAREAHWRGGFVGLLRDRHADAQVVGKASSWLLDALENAWVTSLGELIGDSIAGRRQVASAIRRAEAAFVAERRAFLLRRLSFLEYADIVREKTAWFRLAARALADRAGRPRRDRFDSIYTLLMLSLQTFDDALDVEEDKALRGMSFGELLGLSPSSLVLISRELAELCARECFDGGLEPLGEWLKERAGNIDAAWPHAISPLDGVGAAAFIDAAGDIAFSRRRSG